MSMFERRGPVAMAGLVLTVALTACGGWDGSATRVLTHGPVNSKTIIKTTAGTTFNFKVRNGDGDQVTVPVPKNVYDSTCVGDKLDFKTRQIVPQPGIFCVTRKWKSASGRYYLTLTQGIMRTQGQPVDRDTYRKVGKGDRFNLVTNDKA